MGLKKVKTTGNGGKSRYCHREEAKDGARKRRRRDDEETTQEDGMDDYEQLLESTKQAILNIKSFRPDREGMPRRLLAGHKAAAIIAHAHKALELEGRNVDLTIAACLAKIEVP